MTIISVIPFFYIDDLNLSIYAFVIILLLGICFIIKSLRLYQDLDDISARRLMIASFAYLPLMQIVYVLDKFLF